MVLECIETYKDEDMDDQRVSSRLSKLSNDDTK